MSPGAGISVVIPTFNRADLLVEALHSVLAQTLRPDEVIVVDDGSTDRTREAVASFGSSVRYIPVEHGGVCRARNTGVRRSSGEYLAFCDSDDLWSPDKLQWQMRLVGHGAPYVFTDFLTLRDGRILPGTKFASLPPGYWDVPRRDLGDGLLLLPEPFYGRILRREPIFPSTVLMSRALFDRLGGFDENLGSNVAEDLEFTLRCLQHAPIGVVMRPLVTIRKHSSNVSRDSRRGMLDEVTILRIALERHAAAAAFRGDIESEIVRRCAYAADLAFAEGDVAATRQILEGIARRRLGWKSRFKLAIARLPPALAGGARRVTLALSHAWGRARTPAA